MTIKQFIADIEKEHGKQDWARITNPACANRTFEELAIRELWQITFPPYRAR